MSDKMLISVIVPVYNVQNYVSRCIESIINQTYQNLEILLVDDGSTDESGKICDEYAENDSRIKVFHKENGGLAEARNYALDRANGELIACVDGDDWIHPQMYEILWQVMKVENADIVTCDYERETNKVNDFLTNVVLDSDIIVNMSGTEAIIDIETPLVVAWNKLYKKKVFEKIRYPIGRLHEDEFVIHRLFRQCEKVTVIRKALYFYVIRKESIIANMSEKRIFDAIDAFADRIEFAIQENWDEVLSAVVTRYCDYCIDQYQNIKSGRYHGLDDIAERLRHFEKAICKKYSYLGINRKYIYFAKSPYCYMIYCRICSLLHRLRIGG